MAPEIGIWQQSRDPEEGMVVIVVVTLEDDSRDRWLTKESI
jgi:hypothetical protein